MATKYTQAFIISMDTGAVALVHVKGENPAHGEGLAIATAQNRLDGQVYHMCSFPVQEPFRHGAFELLRPEGNI